MASNQLTRCLVSICLVVSQFSCDDNQGMRVQSNDQRVSNKSTSARTVEPVKESLRDAERPERDKIHTFDYYNDLIRGGEPLGQTAVDAAGMLDGEELLRLGEEFGGRLGSSDALSFSRMLGFKVATDPWISKTQKVSWLVNRCPAEILNSTLKNYCEAITENDAMELLKLFSNKEEVNAIFDGQARAATIDKSRDGIRFVIDNQENLSNFNLSLTSAFSSAPESTDFEEIRKSFPDARVHNMTLQLFYVKWASHRPIEALDALLAHDRSHLGNTLRATMSRNEAEIMSWARNQNIETQKIFWKQNIKFHEGLRPEQALLAQKQLDRINDK